MSTTETTDPYRILGVSRTTSADAIVKSYRRLAMKWHPDRHFSQEDKIRATSRMKQVNAAYAMLSDPDRKNDYDEDNPPPKTSSARDGRQGPRTAIPTGDNLAIIVTVPIKTAINGGAVNIEPYREIACPECCGDGFDFNDHRCGRCAGDGYILDQSCGFTLRVRPGVITGSILVAKYRGGVAPRGGLAGDLSLEIKVTSDSEWIVSGLSLHGRMRVPFSTALLGGHIMVSLPSGERRAVLVPQHTDSGAKLRIPRGGLYDALNDLKGDAFVTITIALPTSPKSVTSLTERTIRDLYL